MIWIILLWMYPVEKRPRKAEQTAADLKFLLTIKLAMVLCLSVRACLGRPAAQYQLTADIPAGYFGDPHTAHCLPGYLLYTGSTAQNLTCDSRGKWGAIKCVGKD